MKPSVSYDEGLKERLKDPAYAWALYEAMNAENARLRAAIEQIRRYADNEEVEMVCKETLAACGCSEAHIKKLEDNNWQLRQALRLCATRAGIADPNEACRMVIATAKEALGQEKKA